jgi:3-oxoacyl-[acyl-carrier protein] reductase
MIDPELSGRTALVTGASNPEGIGVAIARALGQQGARVFITGLAIGESAGGALPEPGPERTRALQALPVAGAVAALRRSGVAADGVDWDLADTGRLGALFELVESRLGAVEVLVNNAAHSREDTFLPAAGEGPADDGISAESHDRHFAVNSRAAALLMREFVRRHVGRRAGWGRIINVSTDGASGHAGAVSYGASKHALESYSRAAAWEVGRHGITVNVVAPGPVQTGWIPAGVEQALRSQIPLGRIGTPEDVADAVLFLASAQARWITGQILYVGGGQVMGL